MQDSPSPPPSKLPAAPTSREDREARRAAALRENLRRRKAQARARARATTAEAEKPSRNESG